MKDEQVTLPNHITDELYRAAKRSAEEAYILCADEEVIVIPNGIFNRLQEIIKSADKHIKEEGIDWRP